MTVLDRSEAVQISLLRDRPLMGLKLPQPVFDPNPAPSSSPSPAPAAAPSPAPAAAPSPSPAPAVTPDPSATPSPTPSATPAATPAPAVDPDNDPSKPDWRDRRISQLTAQLRAKNVAAATPSPSPAPGTVTLTQAEIDEQVNSRASALAATNEFNRQTQEVVNAGRLAYPDFDSKTSALTKLVNVNDNAELTRYHEFLATTFETGKAAEILHALGGDLNEASRILALSPVKQAMELTKLAGKIAAPPEVDPITKAPKPITPVGNRGGSHTQIDPSDPERADTLDTKTWMQRREAQLAPAQGRGNA